MDFEDKVIVCQDCGKEFAHTVDDQKRYAERGFTADPKRCRECRQVRKDKAASSPGGQGARPQVGGGGRSGDRPQGGGGGRGFRGPPRERSEGFRSGGGGHGRPPRASFDAVCAACGIQTTVPFEPTQGRDVFCRDCFRKMRQES